MHAIPTATPRRLATTLFAIGAYLHAAVGCVSSTTSPPKADVVELSVTDNAGKMVTETIDFGKDLDAYLDHIIEGMPGHTDLVFSRTTRFVLDTGHEMVLEPSDAGLSLTVDGTPSVLSFTWDDAKHKLVMDTHGTKMTMDFGKDSRAKEHAGKFVLATLAASQTELPDRSAVGQGALPVIIVVAASAAIAIVIACAPCYLQCWWAGHGLASCSASVITSQPTEGGTQYSLSLNCDCDDGSGSGS